MSEFQIVVCELGGEHYGLDIAAVYEIIRLQPITAVPRAPDCVEGVINLRGRIIPVIDLASRFGIAGAARAKETRIVVAAAAEEVSAATEELSAQTEEVVASAAQLADMASALDELVARFTLTRETAAGATKGTVVDLRARRKVA